ncbi:MAG: cadherin-like domain-containing protein [Pseudomonadota bacterium]
MATNDPTQILTYATLSSAAYGKGAVPIGWTLLATPKDLLQPPPTSGFDAIAVRNNATGEIVIAYRGTDDGKDIAGNWLQLALQNEVPKQLPEAGAFYQRVRDTYGGNITLTGHSLGGALAQLVAALAKSLDGRDVQARAFNAPGVEGIYRNEMAIRVPEQSPLSATAFTNITNYNMAFDPVSSRGVQLGASVNYDPSSLEGLQVFGAIVAGGLNPSLGVLIFGRTLLGSHYIDRLQEAIATERPTDVIDGWRYDPEGDAWSRPATDGGVDTIADADTAARLSAQRQANLDYNVLIPQTRKWLTEYRHWEAATAQLRERYGQVWTDYDPDYDNIGWIYDANQNPIAQFEIYQQDGQTYLKVLGEGGQTVNLTAGEVSGIGTLFRELQSGLQTLLDGVSTYGPTLIDALSLIRAIQTGEPLPVVASGLRLANSLSNLSDTPNLNLSGAAHAASGVLSLYSLANALERGDGIAAVSAGAQAVSFAATAYANFAGHESLSAAIAAGEFGSAGQAIGVVAEALPYLNLINAIAHGDEVGAAVSLISFAVPAVGIAYTVFSLIDALFGDEEDIPDPWGSGQFVWDGQGIRYQAAGETGGKEAVENVMASVVATLNALIERERQQNPGSQLGLIPNRMPGIGYDLSGFRYTDIDPLTGAEKHPALRFDTAGRPYNAEPGSPESYRSIIEGMVYSALSRGAIAPLWEVQTAKLQTDAGDPRAGLTEEERAGRDGQLAAPLTGSSQTFRPVALDLDNDGLEVTDKAHGVAFDVDDSGYLKQTAWVKSDDAFLVLDRNYNGSIDSGRELFSNGAVALSRRGLAGMAWIDANYDGKLTALDPVWNELKLWRDLDQDGGQDAGEVQTLAEAGITELNYAMSTFTRNGVKRQLASPDLEADSQGSRVSVVQEGILVQRSEDGRLSLLVTRIDDRTQVEANRDGVSGYEDVEIIVSPADLLANDTLGGFTGRDLTITGLANFRHGTGFIDANGFIHFLPEANYAGNEAGFDYIARAANGQEGTATVDISLQNVNDAPTLASVDHAPRPIYGYQRQFVSDGSGNDYAAGTWVDVPLYQPYVKTSGGDEWGYGAVTVYHDTPVAYEDTGAGRVIGIDADDPATSLTYQIVNQPQYGQVTMNPDGTFQYTSWKEPGVPSDRIVVGGQYAGTKDGTLYYPGNLPSQAVYPTTDVFQVKITDPHGASTVQSISVPHYGPYYAPTPSGGGGGKKPIAVDLNGNGFEFVNVDDSNVFFDVNGDGWRRRTAWVGQDDGLLAYDIDGDGKIDKPGEISFARYKESAQSDLEGLAAFDSNGDGRLTAADDKWAKFGVWQDANGNGVTDPGEFRTLAEMGITAVELTSDGQFQIIDGQTVRGVGSMTKADGGRIAIADVTLAYSSETLVEQGDGTTQTVSTSPFSPSGEELVGTKDKDLLLGKNGNNIVKGLSGDDVIFEDGGNDIIDGGPGRDLIYSGADNDLVLGGAGDDAIYAGLGNDVVFGGDGHDAILAEGGNDVVFGGAGNDLIAGGWGNDVLSGDDGDDQMYGEAGYDALFGRDGDDELLGMDGNDRLDGGAGDDLLDGGIGADQMLGGAGDDTYGVDDAGDTVTELAGEGIDTVRASIDYTLGTQVENLTLTGSADLAGHGNALDNVLIGNRGNNTLTGGAGNDRLDGGLGADTLTGGSGDDTYLVDNAGDTVVELAGEGLDTVKASVSHACAANVENLALTGTENIDATGNELDNRLTGNAGDNRLDGGAGADVMAGGRGNDTYVVDQVGDVVTENAAEGIDTVISGIDYTLGANIENLALSSAGDLHGTGNELDNVIVGNAGHNVLDGGAGADTLAGGAGDDTYILDNAGDTVIEAADAGTDTVFASVTYTLSANVEDLTLTGSADIDGTGNERANALTGNAGANRLDGGAGADVMAGGAGDDTYVVDDAGDLVREFFGEGNDSVYASVSFVLPEHVENLTLTGSGNIGAGGNGADNVLTGNAGDNFISGGAGSDRLDGQAGNDLLSGGLGNDVLIGGVGNDTYLINLGDGLDQIDDVSGTDTVRFGAGLSLDKVALRVTESNGVHTAQVRVLDAGGCEQADQGFDFAITVDRCGRVTSPIERFEFADGSVKTFDDLLIKTRITLGTPWTTVITTGRDDDIIYGGPRDNVIRSGSGHDIVYAGSGGDTVYGEGGDDYLQGGTGNDTLDGGCGIDVLTGSYRRDTLFGQGGNDALFGGGQDDRLEGGAGCDFLAGGKQDDIIQAGAGANVIAFNWGDGRDVVLPGLGASNTLSLGGGIDESDLVFKKTGSDLILSTGGASQITLKDWYAAAGNQTVDKLQVVEAVPYWGWGQTSSTGWDIDTFDFKALVQQFDAARAANPRLSQWSLMNGRLDAHLAESDGKALGGELATRYAMGGESAISLGVAQDTLKDAHFGSQAQTVGNRFDATVCGYRLG